MLGSTARNPLKRSWNLSGLDTNAGENVDPPAKRSKTWGDHMIQSKSTQFPKTATRMIYPLPKARRVLQAAKTPFTPLPKRVEARCAAVDATSFQIHEDTADEEMSNILTHSANALDISAIETQIVAKMDRGKENVAPTDDSHAVAPVSTAKRAPRMAIMRTKPRKPLGSLDIADFYPQT